MADVLRAILGPTPVAILESFSFRLQDIYNQVRYQISGGQAQIQFASQAQDPVTPVPVLSTPSPVKVQNTAILSSAQEIQPTPAPSSTPEIQSTPVPSSIPTLQNSPQVVSNVVSDAPPLGWQAYGPPVNGAPAMARALVSMAVKRSYASIALVRIDLSRLQLHMMPGQVEPAHPAGIEQTIPYLGMVPADQQSGLIAAFNGGFKQVNGYYGMMVDGITLLPPKPGLGTVAIYSNGQVKIGVWGTEITQTPDMIAFRQNCPPIIEAGVVNQALYESNREAWGTTDNKDITWRTGLGLTQDGRYLIYAVGNGSSAASLAESMRNAGAYMAMQLDINEPYAHFVTYQMNTDPNTSVAFKMVGQRLLAEMIGTSHLYLVPNPRDFFYLTSH